MIRRGVLFCDIICGRIKQQELYEVFYAKSVPETGTYSCPVCGAAGYCRIHAYYKRKLKERERNGVRTYEIRVRRLRCFSCMHTHSVLPDTVVPYRHYGLVFIMFVLYEHYCMREPAEQLCEKWDLSILTFNKWKKVFRDQMKAFAGYCGTCGNEIPAFLNKAAACYSVFSARFYQRTAVSFLQLHKNALDEVYRQAVF